MALFPEQNERVEGCSFIGHPANMNRAYLSISAGDVPQTSDAELFGQLASRLSFALEPAQRAAWEYQITHLRELAIELPAAHFFMEFLIPRMGRRADMVVITQGIIFVVEYKLGARQYDRSSLDQAYGYGLDLKHFHETSHKPPIVPILVATHAPDDIDRPLQWDEDGLAKPMRVNEAGLATAIDFVCRDWGGQTFDPLAWAAGRYRPTPTIVEAAQALYRGHDVEEISRSEAGAENLTHTADYVASAIETASPDNRRYQARACQQRRVLGVTGGPRPIVMITMSSL